MQRTQLKLLQKEPFKKKSGATVDLISNKTAHKIYIYMYISKRKAMNYWWTEIKTA